MPPGDRDLAEAVRRQPRRPDVPRQPDVLPPGAGRSILGAGPAGRRGGVGAGGAEPLMGGGSGGKLAEGPPASTSQRSHLAYCLWVMGTLLWEAGRPAEAEAAWRENLAIQAKLAGDDPANPRFRFDVAGAQLGIGHELVRRGRSGEAEARGRPAPAPLPPPVDPAPTPPTLGRGPPRPGRPGRRRGRCPEGARPPGGADAPSGGAVVRGGLLPRGALGPGRKGRRGAAGRGGEGRGRPCDGPPAEG